MNAQDLCQINIHLEIYPQLWKTTIHVNSNQEKELGMSPYIHIHYTIQ